MMAFPFKDNTNTGGECLYDSCAFCDNEFNTHAYIWCMKEGHYRTCVGICNKYQERKKDNG